MSGPFANDHAKTAELCKALDRLFVGQHMPDVVASMEWMISTIVRRVSDDEAEAHAGVDAIASDIKSHISRCFFETQPAAGNA